jgi:ubiquitin-like protein Pup
MAMQRQTIERRHHRRHEDDDVHEQDVAPAPTEQAVSLAEELDGLLDEIDDVLEENAEEFVSAFVQKGGE